VLNKLILSTLIFSVACTHSVHLVHVGDFRPYQKNTSGKKIEAVTEQFVILGFTQETDYIDLARANLLKQCEDGVIQGPVTRLSTSHGFFSWTNRVSMQALCVRFAKN
jgi:hypothetical protein